MVRLIVFFSSFLFFFTPVNSQEKENDIDNSAKKRIEQLITLQEKYFTLGVFKTFKAYTDSIITLSKKHNLKEAEIDAIIKLGVYYKKTNTYEQSLPYYLQALELTKSLAQNNEKQTTILINLGNLYNQIGYHNKAINVFNKAKSNIDQISKPDEYKFAIYIGLSEAVSANKNFKESLEYLNKAKEIAEGIQRNDMLIFVYNTLGNNYLQLHKYEESLAYSKKSEALYNQGQSIENRTLSLYIMGASLVGLKKYSDAILPLQMAQVTAFTNDYLKIQMNTHKQLAKAFEKIGDLKKANQQQKGYINTQQKYLLSLSKAKRLEVEKDLKQQKAVVHNRGKFILLGIFVIFILLGLLLLFIKKKKKAQLEAVQLKENQILLKDENEALKTKIYKLTQQKTVVTTDANKINSGVKKSTLNQKEREKYIQHILDFMEKEEPYLDHEINQYNIAKKLDMSVHLFSEVLNVCFEKNFNNFINLYRVDKAKQLMKNPKYNHYKVLAIGYEAGFPSKTSFYRVFKQLVEQTPSEYRQKQSA